MDKQELKNCICGAGAFWQLGKLRHCQLHGEPYQSVFVKCTNSQCSYEVEAGDVHNGGQELAFSEAVTVWNTRPEEDRLNARIKELEAGLQHIINHVEMGMQGGVKAFSMHAHWYIATKTLNKGNKND